MRFVGYDVGGPEESGQVVSFVLADPEKPGSENTYCIGYKFLGASPVNPRNYRYDHANYWNHDDRQEEPIPVTKRRAVGVLRGVNTCLPELLRQYLATFSNRKK